MNEIASVGAITMSGTEFLSLIGAMFTLAIFLYTIRIQIKASHTHLENLMNVILPAIVADQKAYMVKTDTLIKEQTQLVNAINNAAVELRSVVSSVIAIEANTRHK